MSNAKRSAKLRPPFWHRVLIPAAFRKGGTKWHLYGANGYSICGRYALFGLGVPDDARTRMPSKARGNDICSECERKCK